MTRTRHALTLSAVVLLVIMGAAAYLAKYVLYSLPGVWSGRLDGEAARPRFVFDIWADKSGKLSGRLNSPQRLLWGLPFDAISMSGDEVVMEVRQYGLKFSGHFSLDGRAIDGRWLQAGRSLPLVLRRGTDEVQRRPRSQEPVPPFPYDTEDVTFENTKAGVRIAGTLTRPHASTPVAAVLLTACIGADRDETGAGHKTFLVLADYLTRRGIAVLRIDGRGVGGSGGSGLMSTTADFADDALAGVGFLKHKAGIDPARVGLLGHSEGGLIASIAAQRSSDVAFVVMMGPMGIPGAENAQRQANRSSRTG